MLLLSNDANKKEIDSNSLIITMVNTILQNTIQLADLSFTYTHITITRIRIA